MTVEPPASPFYEKVLFCTDFSENADFAFDFAIDAVRRRPGSTLLLLHVLCEVLEAARGAGGGRG